MVAIGMKEPVRKLSWLPTCRSGGVFEGHRLPDPADGRRVRQLLHARGDADPHPRVPVARRGDEEDRPQGGQAVLRHRRRRAALHQDGHPTALFQKFLEPPHGARPAQLPPARRHHRRDRQPRRRRRDHRTRRRRPQGTGHVANEPFFFLSWKTEVDVYPFRLCRTRTSSTEKW